MSDSELRDQKVFLQSFPLQLSKKKKEKTTEQVRTTLRSTPNSPTPKWARLDRVRTEQRWYPSIPPLHWHVNVPSRRLLAYLTCFHFPLIRHSFILTSLSSPRSLSVALARFLALCCNLLCCAVLCCAVLCCAVTVRCGGVCRHAGDR